ncbi:hypothetical protein ACFVH0_16345 [Streptomyces sp. NPDC127117]
MVPLPIGQCQEESQDLGGFALLLQHGVWPCRPGGWQLGFMT